MAVKKRPDADKLPQYPPPADKYQGWAEVDRSKFQSVAGGGANCTVKGPGGAINRQGECVDQRRAQPSAAQPCGAPINKEGEQKQQRHVTGRYEQKCIGGKHEQGP